MNWIEIVNKVVNEATSDLDKEISEYQKKFM